MKTRRARGRAAVVAACAAVSLFQATAAQAFFSSSSARSMAVGTATIGAPSALTATALGGNVALGWSAGAGARGYAVAGASNGASSDCSKAPFASIGSSSTTSYTDVARDIPQGTWFCYRTVSTAGAFTSATGNPVAATQMGFFTRAATATNALTAGTLEAGDSFAFTFNQPVATSTGPSALQTVCWTQGAGGQILFGVNALLGPCQTTETTTLGKLTGGGSGGNGRASAVWTWSANNTVLTVTLGTIVAGTASALTGSWTFNPTTAAGNIRSASGSVHVCDTNAGGGACLPALSGTV